MGRNTRINLKGGDVTNKITMDSGGVKENE